MPTVWKKTFPYTSKWVKAAKKASVNTGTPMKIASTTKTKTTTPIKWKLNPWLAAYLANKKAKSSSTTTPMMSKWKMLKVEMKVDKKEPKIINAKVMAKHDKMEPKKMEIKETKLVKKATKKK